MAEKTDLGIFWENRCGVSDNSEQEGKTNEMFLRIITGDGVTVKSQQRNENELTIDEKTEILHELYEQKPSIFLSRFGKWLSERDLDYFSEISSSYEMDYTIKKLKRNLAQKSSRTDVKNRRYEALMRLENDSDYFTEHEMRQRCPLLYEQYIGQYMTEEEKLERDQKEIGDEATMSSFIFQQIDRDWMDKKQKMEQEREEECMEEEEEEDEDEEEEEEDEEEEEEEKEENVNNKGNNSSGMLLILFQDCNVCKSC